MRVEKNLNFFLIDPIIFRKKWILAVKRNTIFLLNFLIGDFNVSKFNQLQLQKKSYFQLKLSTSC